MILFYFYLIDSVVIFAQPHSVKRESNIFLVLYKHHTELQCKESILVFLHHHFF